MAKLFILIKKKGSSRYLGAIPVKSGVSVSALKVSIRRRMKAGYSYKIVNEARLRLLIERMRPRGSSVKSSKGVNRRRLRRVVRHLRRRGHRVGKRQVRRLARRLRRSRHRRVRSKKSFWFS